MFLPNKTIKIYKFNYPPKNVGKTTQYGGDVVMFLPNKKIKNKVNYRKKKNIGQKNNTIWGRCCNVPT